MRYLFFITKLYGYSIARPIQNAILRRGDEAAWFIHEVSNKFLREDEKELASIAEVFAYNPDAVFSCSNWVPYFFPGAKIQLFHGFNAEKRDDDAGHFRIRGWFDLYCTQGPSTTLKFKQLARKHKYFCAVETGWSKVDPLFQPVKSSIPCKPLKSDRPVVLYTSTFTRQLSGAPHLIGTIAKLASSGRWHWLVNLHPKMDPGIADKYRALQGNHLTFIETDDITPLLVAADVMVSDTSSVVFEFMLLDKPVVTFRHRNPGPHILDIDEAGDLEMAIETALSYPKTLMEEARKYCDWLHPYRDGKSSERVLDATENFLAHDYGRLGRKPLNLARKLSVRYKLGHYGW